VVFVTVDPKRDVPAELSKYVAAFNPSFKALYGTEEQTVAVAKEFKVIYQKAQVKDENTYLVDHSTQMYAFDPQGRIRLMIRHEAGVDAIAKDLTTLARL
jgi:protein SCO1